jgi:uncharacterized protein YrrD
MYVLASSLKHLPVISLHNSQIVSSVTEPIVNPDNLEVVAVYCQSGFWRKRDSVIMTRDIREIAREGLVIDSLEDIEDASEIIRLKRIIEKQYNPIGAYVITESQAKLGKVEDFTIETSGYRIQKLYLKQSLLKNLLLNSLIIDRSQIVDVTPTAIVVKDATLSQAAKKPARALAPHPATPTPE